MPRVVARSASTPDQLATTATTGAPALAQSPYSARMTPTRLLPACWCLLLAPGVAGIAAAQSVAPGDTRPPVVRVSRRTASISIDGQLDEGDWKRPPVVDSLTQSSPTEGAPASERSEIWMTFDDEAVYVAARYHDQSPDSVMAYLVRRDRQNQSDLFMLYLDPYRDGQNGYQFIVNAAGVQREGTLFADNFTDDTWDAVWESAVRRDATGWTVELRVPLSQLRMLDRPVQQWGVNFGRGIGRRSEVSFLVPRLRQGAGFVSRFARLEGMDDLRPRSRRELLPYVTQKAEMREARTGDPFFSGRRLSPGAGLDFRLGLGANLQVDGALNPDFGQVELDPAVVNLSDFEVFFQERRPFFVEGTNIFRFGQGGASGTVSYDWPTVTPFYSRRIGRAPAGRGSEGAHFTDAPSTVTILGASKVTGRMGEWNVGALTALTSRESARIAGPGAPSDITVEPWAGYAAARAQRATGDGRRGLGVLGTFVQRESGGSGVMHDVNRTAAFAGIDGWLGLDDRRDWVLLGQFGASQVTATAERMRRLQASAGHYFQRPDAPHLEFDPQATAMRGAFGRVQLHKQRGATYFHTAVGAVTPGFEGNDLGFVARTDHVNAHVMTGRRWTRPSAWYQSAALQGGLYSSWDFGGTRTRLGFAPTGNIQFRNFSTVWASAQLLARALDNRATRGGPLMTSPPSSTVLVGWSSDFRRPFSYGVSGGVTAIAGARAPGWSVELESEWRPSASVNIRVGPGLSRTRAPAQPIGSVADERQVATFGRRYLFGELDQHQLFATLRTDWIFSPIASFELFLQPLVSSVHYESIRELERPRSFDLLTYGTRGSTYDAASGAVDPDGSGPAPSFSIGRPDFTFASLRGTAVFRWEYRRGSTLYLVWTQNRASSVNDGTFAPGASFDRLLSGAGEHVFLLKASYWLSR